MLIMTCIGAVRSAGPLRWLSWINLFQHARSVKTHYSDIHCSDPHLHFYASVRRMCSRHASPNVLAAPAEWARLSAEWARRDRRMGSKNQAAERARARRPRKVPIFIGSNCKRAHSADFCPPNGLECEELGSVHSALSPAVQPMQCSAQAYTAL